MCFDDVEEWEMGYGDLILKRVLGKGHSGLVMLGCLHESTHLPKIKDYIKRQRAQEGCFHPRLVAVKRFKGRILSAVHFIVFCIHYCRYA